MLPRVFTLATVLVMSACAQVTRAPHVPPPPPSAERIRGSDTVVDVTGLGEIKIGRKRRDLTDHLNTELPGCHTQLRAHPQGSAVFTQDGQLVLMWFNAPLKTAEGISTGTPAEEVRATYQHATEVKAPEGSHRFDGLLVTSGQHGYLFLHDGKTVQKAIVGYVDYLRRLFDSGFGAC